jgi:hypothetical protein
MFPLVIFIYLCGKCSIEAGFIGVVISDRGMDTRQTQERLSSRISSGVTPALISVIIYCTVIRLPAMQGRPPQIPGVVAINVPMSVRVGILCVESG